MTSSHEERKRLYTRSEIAELVDSEELEDSDDYTWLCALSTYAMVISNNGIGGSAFAGLKTICIPVIHTDTHQTGYYFEPGQEPIIVINEDRSILDYDFISELHPVHESEVYLWLSDPWTEPDIHLGVHGEWYRSDTYKDGIERFNGKSLDWEDLPPIDIIEEDE